MYSDYEQFRRQRESTETLKRSEFEIEKARHNLYEATQRSARGMRPPLRSAELKSMLAEADIPVSDTFLLTESDAAFLLACGVDIESI